MKVFKQIAKPLTVTTEGKIAVDPNEFIGTFGLYLQAVESDGSTSACRKCALYGSGLCSEFACFSFERTDDYHIYFRIAKITK